MLFGLENITTKFIIKRQRQNGKESYDTLFDGFTISNKNRLKALIKKLEADSNPIHALNLFQMAIGDNTLKFDKLEAKSYKIIDISLKIFLETYPSIVYKSIFLNSTTLQLCDYEHNLLCEITWNKNIIKQYLSKLNSVIYTPLQLQLLSFQNAKEDIITYASVQIFQKLGCKILSVSYPGAQGDRAILIGQGRQTKRIYLDIIACKKSQKFFVFLHENKEKQNDLKKDEEKLLNLTNNHLDSIHSLFHKLGYSDTLPHDNLYVGLGSKKPKNDTLISPFFNIDYFFSFDIQSSQTYTTILYNIAVINLDLFDIFKPLANSNNKLQGCITLDTIYKA